MVKMESIILEKDQYLNEVLPSLPWGIIDKKSTGVGATTTEIRDLTRSSFIVCPTRSLAATKAISEQKRYQHVYYRGGYYPGVSKVRSEEVLQLMEAKEIIKILVVADSFPILLEEIGKQAYTYFHLTIDEIDSFQIDIDFRQSLAKVYAEIFEFPRTRCSFISATIQSFRDERLQKLNRITVEKVNNDPPELVVIQAPNGIERPLIWVITQILRERPDDKILIGYNSITDILSTIGLLNDDLKPKICVLCGSNSKESVEQAGYSGSISDEGKLSHQITFTTSAFFVGFDIQEKLSAIAVADVNNSQTLLPIPRIHQFFGRARHGLIYRVLVHNSKSTNSFDLDDLATKIKSTLSFAENFIKMANSPEINVLSERTRNNFREAVVGSLSFYGVPVIGHHNNALFVNYLAFDCAEIDQKSKNFLYSSNEKAIKYLSDHFKVLDYTYDERITPVELNQIEVTTVNNDLSIDDWIISNILSGQWGLARTRPIGINSSITQKVKKILSIINYVPWFRPEGIAEVYRNLREETIEVRSLTQLINILTLYSQPRTSDFWRMMYALFELNQVFTGKEIKAKVEQIWQMIDKKSLLPSFTGPSAATQWLKKVFITKDAKNRDGQRCQRIIGDHWGKLSTKDYFKS